MSGVFGAFVTEQGKLVLDYPSAFRAYAKRLAGEECELEIRKRRTKRSDRQNRALHAAITPWARELGCSVDELKRDLLGTIFGWSEKVSPLSEQRMPSCEHTSTLSTVDFAHLMEETMRIAAETGYVIEDPTQYKTRKLAEAKREKRGKAA